MFDVWLVFLFGFAGYVFRKLDYPLEPLVLAHGGGALPFLIGRLNLGYYAPKYEFNTDCQKNISPPPWGVHQTALFRLTGLQRRIPPVPG